MTNTRDALIHELSNRLVKAQYPVRILDAIKWPDYIKHDFLANNGTKLPSINREFYINHAPLKFNPEDKIQEFMLIKNDIRTHLGKYSGIGSIMQRMCYEYIKVVEMLQERGSAKFSLIAQELYGSTNDSFYPGSPTLKDTANLITTILSTFTGAPTTADDKEKFTSKDAVLALRRKLIPFFADTKININVSDAIVSDAAAGAESIKIRKQARFTQREINILEVHEGWVHLATTFNGMAQPICNFLSKGPPSATVTQEGLGVLTELLTFLSYPQRIAQLNNRVLAIHMAEQGADFVEIFKFYQAQDLNQEEAYNATVRVFRGSTPTGQPFPKDLSYCKGFTAIYNYMILAVQRGLIKHIPLLFLGKTTLEDLPILADLVEENIISKPKYLPPPFQDLNALSAWMCFSVIFEQLNFTKSSAYFKTQLN